MLNKITILILVLLCSLNAHAELPEQLTIAFQKLKDPAKLHTEAQKVAQSLEQIFKRKIKTQIPTDYGASVQALVSGTADIAYLDSLSFLLARRDGGAKVLLAEQRIDTTGKLRTDYDSVFVVRKDSPYQNLEQALKDKATLTVAFTSPTSTSGYVFPYRRLVKESVLQPGGDPAKIFKKVQFGGSYVQTVEQVLNKRADICAVSYYVVEGDSSKKYLSDQQLGELRILERNPGVPTHVIAIRKGFSLKDQIKLKAGLLKLTKKMPELLTDVYGTATFIDVDEEKHLQASIEAVEYIGLPIEDLKKKKG